MRFSSRLPADLRPNPLAESLMRARRSGRTIADLTESNPTQVGLTYPEELLAPLADPRGLVYDPHPFGIIAAREAVADEFARRGQRVSPNRIALTASTSEAYSMLFKLLCDAGDEVLVPRPSYPLFDHLTELDAIAAVPYRLVSENVWSFDLNDLTSAVSPRTRAVLIVNPNNPTGSFIKRQELERVAAICRDHSLAIIGDEVFGDYCLDEFAEPTTVFEAKEVLVFSLGGLSKSVGLPQLKLSWIGVGGPAALVGEALERLEVICDTYLSVSTPVQQATRSLLHAGSAVRDQILQRIAINHQELNQMAAAYRSCRVLRAEGGWYAVIQVPATTPEQKLTLDLLEQDRVLVHPGYFFDFDREAFLVVSLLPPPDIFARAVRKVFARSAG